MAKSMHAGEIAIGPKPDGITLSRWFYEELRRAILDGRLRRGARLPPTRQFAAEYGVSRRTAVTVFEQLRAEGYVEGRVGSGTRVNEQLPEDVLESGSAGIPQRGRPATSNDVFPLFRRPARPFRSIEPALAEFPMTLWARVASRCLRRVTPAMLAGGSPGGYKPLREVIAAYLGASRGVNCTADQVVVVSGAQQGIDLLARLLISPGDAVWMEDPGYTGAQDALRKAGAKLVPVPVDDSGMDPVRGRKLCPNPRLVYVTPAHQFPLGVTMTLERRLALLAAARESGALIIEDDYDSEFRFSGRPVPALQGLDRSENVVVVGTFNKVLFLSLRIGYIVLPHRLVDSMLALRWQTDRFSAVIPQAILADFISDGHFGRHLRRMRQMYSVRLAALLDNSRQYLRGLLEVPRIQAGLHAPAYLVNGMSSRDAQLLAANAGVESAALDEFGLRRRDIRGLLLGFAAFDEREIRRGTIALAKALDAGAPRPRAVR